MHLGSCAEWKPWFENRIESHVCTKFSGMNAIAVARLVRSASRPPVAEENGEAQDFTSPFFHINNNAHVEIASSLHSISTFTTNSANPSPTDIPFSSR